MDGEDTSPTGVGVAIAALGIIAVGLRFYTRYNKQAGLKWDDWLILASLLLGLTTDVLVVYSSSVDPIPDETWTPTEENNDPDVKNSPKDILFNQFSFIETILYFSITSTTKLSILLLYNRLFSVSNTFRRQIIILSIVVIGYWIGSTIANILNCIPLKYIWINDDEDPRFCFDYNIFWFATGISEAFIDVFILLLPIGVVTKLQLSTKKKVATGSVFLVGVLVIVSGLIKAVYGLDPSSRVPSFGRTLIWSTVHTGTGIICACLPVCWPAFASLGHFGERAWARSITTRELGHSWSGWSRLRTGSAREESATRYETFLDTDGRVRMLALDPASMEPFDVGFDVEKGVESAVTRPPKGQVKDISMS
ncbi:hypothetical protein E0Z10_g6170 [Xylaria hypoxylon]|uniref:Rhodopsin domain-containing protein n=1 Tax=Xylaria hypoxylon TaxID=37992 RepID=A0A4Z0YGP9_9PEZI|nr:hypothetical protein E0Z10_g6170 [Xylaria hypoxylon]